MGNLDRPLPILDYKVFQQPQQALQRFLQIVGKIRLATVPPRNHWWHATLIPTARGLTTGPMPIGKGDFPDTFELDFDFINHRIKGTDSWGHSFLFSLLNLSVAEFYRNLCHELSAIDIQIPIHAFPYKIEPHIAFQDDHQHVYDSPDIVTIYFDTLRFADHQLKIFGSSYIGKQSSPQFFWHSMDLAMTRFSGREAFNSPSKEVDAVAHEAYSHEVISFGYWAGDEHYPHPAFYSYTAPLPENLTKQTLQPKTAFWDESPKGVLAILPYEKLRISPVPGESVQEFFHSAYEAGCSCAHWPEEMIEAAQIGENRGEIISHQIGPLN